METSKKKQKSQDFWKRKQEAFRLFGSATTRPQEQFRNYLLAKRKLNLGYMTRSHSQQSRVSSWTPHLTDISPPIQINDSLISGKPMIVESDESFSKMLIDLSSSTEFALDFEFNQDHSFLGK
jgi:hypothetical protein